MSNLIQKLLWKIGIAIHNPIRDECTPDFNCCEKVDHWSVDCRSCGVRYGVKNLHNPYLTSCRNCYSHKITVSRCRNRWAFIRVGMLNNGK